MIKFKDFLESRNPWKKWLLVGFCLVILSLFLKARVGFLKRENQKNLTLLDKSLPGFSNQSPRQLKQEINGLNAELISLSALFYPKERWLKENYDLSILFVEDLNNVNQALKNKAREKQLDFADLDFPDKLPPESEAIYLLTQLYGLKEVVNLGMDLGINFKSIKPEGIEKIEGLTKLELVRNYLELVCPKETLIEFIIQLNDIIPKVHPDSLLIKSEDASFKIDLSFSNVVLDLDWKALALKELPIVKLDEPFLKMAQNLTPILRNKNPFFVTRPKDKSQLPSEGKIYATREEGKPVPRFFYRGKAILKTKEVVVIEDTLNKETVFLGLGEKYGNLKLNYFSDEDVILENINDGNKIFIKRGRQ